MSAPLSRSESRSEKAAKSGAPGGWLWGPMSRTGFIWGFWAFLLDQAHKTWMLNVAGFEEGDHVVVTPFLDFVLIWNRGVSYGLLQQEELWGRLLLALFSLAAVVALAVWLARAPHTRLAAIAIGMIGGGALGNGLDRLIRPGVADFFSLHAFGYNWYVFNIADIAIVAGVAILLYDAVAASVKSASKPTHD